MTSNGLNREQLRIICERVRREVHYFDRLTGLMRQKHFPADDPLWIKATEAQKASASLLHELERLVSVAIF